MGNLKRTVAIDSVSVRSVDDNGFLHVQKSPLTRVQVAPYYGQEIAGWRELGLDPERSITPIDRLRSSVLPKRFNR